jgi:hypothetical protein
MLKIAINPTSTPFNTVNVFSVLSIISWILLITLIGIPGTPGTPVDVGIGIFLITNKDAF